MSISTVPLPGTSRDPFYPDSDGEPMAETQLHAAAMVELWQSLTGYFSTRADVYVGINMFLYYEQGNPRARRAPDVFVSIGVSGNHPRRSFRIWEEKVPPTVIFELTSLKTRREDKIEKTRVYASIGVAEYFMFDPVGEYLRPRLQGYRLGATGYERIAAEADGELRLLSQELGMIIEPEGDLPRLTDARTQRPLPSLNELRERAATAAVAVSEAEKRASRAEKQTKLAQRRAEAESRRAAALEEEIRRLRGER
jgi:Uma2 family endonuclease